MVERIPVDATTRPTDASTTSMTPVEFSTGKRSRACNPCDEEDLKPVDTSKTMDISCLGGSGLFSGLKELFLSKTLCDVIVIVGDTEFAAHQLVLAASSNFFRCVGISVCVCVDLPSGCILTAIQGMQRTVD